MAAIRPWAHRFAIVCALFLASTLGAFISLSHAQNVPGIDPNIQATLVADGPAIAGQELTLAIHFKPVSKEWHGYWKNPGDAGYGMQLEWDLPEGWRAGEPQYPVPSKLLISNLMNHIYEGQYAVLVPISVPENAPLSGVAQIGLKAEWLACTDEICVPERGELEIALPIGEGDFGDDRFAAWRSAIPPMLDSSATFDIAGDRLRIAIPLPAAVGLAEPHIFIANTDLVQYAAAQTFRRDGDMLVAEIPLANPGTTIDALDGILAFGAADGVRFTAKAGSVAGSGSAFGGSDTSLAGFALLLLGALAGGLILNVMPCVFPILSLKALSLARAGESQSDARREGLAYSAGVILSCVALGAIMLALRAAGEQVGWAFQLQEPAVVAALFVLAALITANLAGLFDLPSLPITSSGEPTGAFMTGILAAVAATPCTGPFMAAALGAALLLPPVQALLLFAALGLGLALPFLLLGFVPALRRRLPKPGPWMETFRRILAVPMGLTMLALIWLLWRLGGPLFAVHLAGMGIAIVLVVMAVWGVRKNIRMSRRAFAVIFAGLATLAAFQAYRAYSPPEPGSVDSILTPETYSAETLAAARASGQPVFAWFTADWCVTCKVNEGIAIEREATRAAFDKAGVVTVRGDWTRRDPAITEYLTEQGAGGVPLYVWYAPGGEARILPQVLTPDSLVTLAQNSPKRSGGTPQSTPQGAGLD